MPVRRARSIAIRPRIIRSAVRSAHTARRNPPAMMVTVEAISEAVIKASDSLPNSSVGASTLTEQIGERTRQPD